jgi:hypothetical protein
LWRSVLCVFSPLIRYAENMAFEMESYPPAAASGHGGPRVAMASLFEI